MAGLYRWSPDQDKLQIVAGKKVNKGGRIIKIVPSPNDEYMLAITISAGIYAFDPNADPEKRWQRAPFDTLNAFLKKHEAYRALRTKNQQIVFTTFTGVDRFGRPERNNSAGTDSR